MEEAFFTADERVMAGGCRYEDSDLESSVKVLHMGEGPSVVECSDDKGL